MAEQAKSAAADWTGAQSDYWDAWMNLALQAMARTRTGEQAGAAPAGAAPDWSGALGRWWETVAPVYPHLDRELLEKLIPQGQGFLLLGEQLVRLSQTLQEAVKNGEDWQASLGQSFASLRETFFRPFTGEDGTHPSLAAFWGLPMDTWQRMASSLSIFPGDALQAARGESHRPPAMLTEGLDRTLGMPALGYTREWQEQAQQGARLWLCYQEANHDYGALLQTAAHRSLDLLRDALVERAENNRPLKTLREAYNLWVDCSEQAYAETLRSPAYSEIQGRMIDALMRCKRHGQRLVDETLSALDVPNRRELNTAHARVQDDRRRLNRLEEQLAAVDAEQTGRLIGSLQEDMRALREELGAERLLVGLQEEIKTLRSELDTVKSGAAGKKPATRKRRTTKATEGKS